MSKNVIFIFLLLINNALLFSQENQPKLFNLNWGATYNEVEKKIQSTDTGLRKLKYYKAFQSRDEYTDLKSSASVKYISEGIPFFDIPAKVIFTFYNPKNNKDDLVLTKIEVFMNKKDNLNLWVDAKAVYKDLIRLFFDIYYVNIDKNKIKEIFLEYNYQVIINGIFVHFIANTGNSILNEDTSVYITYENNSLRNLILKKQNEIIKNESENNNDEDNVLKRTKSNL